MISQNEISLFSSKRVRPDEARKNNKSCHNNNSMNQSSAFKYFNYSQNVMNKEDENEDEDLMQNDKRRRLVITQQQQLLQLQPHQDIQSPKKRSRYGKSNMYSSSGNGHDKDDKEENDEKTRKGEGMLWTDNLSVAESNNTNDTILILNNKNKKRRCESLMLTSRTASPWTSSSSAATTISASSSTTKISELNSCKDRMESLANNSEEYYSSLEPWSNSTISATNDTVTTPIAQYQRLLYRSHPHDSSMSSSEALSTTAEPSLSDRDDEDDDNDECNYHANGLHEEEAAEETDSIATELSQVVDHWSLDPEYDMSLCG
jgi:hypothetical protein